MKRFSILDWITIFAISVITFILSIVGDCLGIPDEEPE
jgi:hypothetical protein